MWETGGPSGTLLYLIAARQSKFCYANNLFHNLASLSQFVCPTGIVTQSTGCDSSLLFEEIYDYYAQAAAWYVAPGAHAALQRLKDSGVLLGHLSLVQLSSITLTASCYVRSDAAIAPQV